MKASNKEASVPASQAAGLEEIQAKLRKLERKDWWLWLVSIVMMPLMAAVVLSFTLAQGDRGPGELFQFQLEQNARGLLALVLIFTIYTIYQQTMLKRLRRQEAEHLFERSKLEIQAEVSRQLAMIDPLTGVYNRRFLDQHLEIELPRAERHGYPLTILMVDLNDFKKANDRFGHPAGDFVLREFSHRLKTTLRSSDVLVRIGGDEFVAVLPDCPSGQVPSLLRRIAGLTVSYRGASIPVTFAVGYVTYQPGELASQLLDRADQAVYADKRACKAGGGEVSGETGIQETRLEASRLDSVR
jgi:diguanylate cyclase (GGDEF)-like protein